MRLTNIIPEQVSEISWGWTSKTDIDGMKYVLDHPGVVNMPDLTESFNWQRWHTQNGPNKLGLLPKNTCSTNMKSIFTTYQRFVGFEEAVVEMEQAALHDITKGFVKWNETLLTMCPVTIDYFIVGDDLASQRAPFIKPEVYEQRYLPFLKELFQVAEQRYITGIFHSCGDIYKLLDMLLELPIEYIHFQKVGRMRKFSTGDILCRDNKQHVFMWENDDPYRNTKGEGKIQ